MLHKDTGKIFQRGPQNTIKCRDGLKGGPVLLSNSQARPGRNFGTFEQWTSRLKFKIYLKYVCNPSIIRIPFIIDPFVIHIPFEFKLSLKLMH